MWSCRSLPVPSCFINKSSNISSHHWRGDRRSTQHKSRYTQSLAEPQEAAAQTVQLVKELLAELPGGVGASFTVVCADLDTASLASERLLNPVSVIDPSESGVTKGPLLIVNPRSDQVGLPGTRPCSGTASRQSSVLVCAYMWRHIWRQTQSNPW